MGRDDETDLSRIELLEAELAKFNWQPADRTPVAHGTIESALIGWRTRCLSAEGRLEKALAELADLRNQVIELGGSPRGRR